MSTIGAPKTWQDAFESNPIPTVRALEKQLRAAASRDKEKLRGLVGGNYRDLLSTAEEIISLDSRARVTESEISGLSQKCKPPQTKGSLQPPPQPARTAAQLRLLSQCTLSAATALKKRLLLLSAELTVISRLLLKSVGGLDDSVPDAVDRLRAHANAHQRQLVRRIDAQLVHPASSMKVMVEAVCAYCLLSSASSGDAIKHFRELRLRKLRERCVNETPTFDQLRETSKYLVTSIQTLKSLLSRGVNEVLGQLQRQPILSGTAVIQSDTLAIDQIRSLIPADILTFTPYIKRVVLQATEITDIVQSWSQEASQIFSSGLSQALLATTSTSEVLLLRKDLLSLILPVYFSTSNQANLLKSIREAINVRVVQLCQQQTETVLLVGDALATVDTGVAKSSSLLWEDSFVQKPLSSDSSAFLRQVQGRHLGTKGGLDHALRRLRKWAASLKRLRELLYDLRKARWQDLVEEADDEDEDEARLIVVSLTTDDPLHYGRSLEIKLEENIAKFNERLNQGVSDVLSTPEPSVTKIVFFLRALRESSAIIWQSMPDFKPPHARSYTGLFAALAKHVTTTISTKFEDSKIPPRIESLPDDLPSPLTFSVLREVCLVMSESGGNDIWSAQAVATLKNELRQRLLQQSYMASYIQTDFDQAYLKQALSNSVEGDEVTENDKEQSSDTTRKAALYWTRTKLLFGMLA